MLKFMVSACHRSMRGPVVKLVLAILLGCFFSPAILATQDIAANRSALSLKNYESELDRLTDGVLGLAEHPGGIDAFRNTFPASWVVDAGGQQQLEISNKWLNDALSLMAKEPVERKRLCEAAAERLQFLKAEAERFANAAAGPDDAMARLKLGIILKQREFQRIERENWLAQLWHQIRRWIDWLINRTIGRLIGPGAVRTTLVWLIIGIVFVIAAFWLARSLGRIARTEALRADTLFTPGKTWRDWVREAHVASSKGDYRATVHRAYWAGVYRLADLGIWQLDLAKTPREYLRLLERRAIASPDATGGDPSQEKVAPPAGSAAALGELTRSMEAVWYGYLPATQRDSDTAFQHLETLGCR